MTTIEDPTSTTSKFTTTSQFSQQNCCVLLLPSTPIKIAFPAAFRFWLPVLFAVTCVSHQPSVRRATSVVRMFQLFFGPPTWMPQGDLRQLNTQGNCFAMLKEHAHATQCCRMGGWSRMSQNGRTHERKSRTAQNNGQCLQGQKKCQFQLQEENAMSEWEISTPCARNPNFFFFSVLSFAKRETENCNSWINLDPPLFSFFPRISISSQIAIFSSEELGRKKLHHSGWGENCNSIAIAGPPFTGSHADG